MTHDITSREVVRLMQAPPRRRASTRTLLIRALIVLGLVLLVVGAAKGEWTPYTRVDKMTDVTSVGAHTWEAGEYKDVAALDVFCTDGERFVVLRSAVSMGKKGAFPATLIRFDKEPAAVVPAVLLSGKSLLIREAFTADIWTAHKLVVRVLGLDLTFDLRGLEAALVPCGKLE